MKKQSLVGYRCRNSTVLGFLILSVLSVVAVAQEQNGAAPVDTLRVLYVGNSFSYYNNQPGILELVARGGRGPAIVAERITRPGATLFGLTNDTDLLSRITGGSWDFVILQEQSTLGRRTINGRAGMQDPRFFVSSVKNVASAIRRSGAVPVLFLTWGRERFPEDLDRLVYAYRVAGAETGATIAPVGPAWAAAHRTHPSVVLYDPDGSHPSPAGSFVSAMVIYSIITGRPASDSLDVTIGPAVDTAGEFTGDSLDLVPREIFGQGLASLAYRVSQDWSGAIVGDAPNLPLAPAFPPPDESRPPAAEGNWSGSLSLLPIPGTMTLSIGSGGRALHWSLRFPRPGFDIEGAVSESRIEDGTLRFKFEGVPGLRGGALEFWAAHSNGEIFGVARHVADGGQTEIVGEFRLSPAN